MSKSDRQNDFATSAEKLADPVARPQLDQEDPGPRRNWSYTAAAVAFLQQHLDLGRLAALPEVADPVHVEQPDQGLERACKAAAPSRDQKCPLRWQSHL